MKWLDKQIDKRLAAKFDIAVGTLQYAYERDLKIAEAVRKIEGHYYSSGHEVLPINPTPKDIGEHLGKD